MVAPQWLHNLVLGLFPIIWVGGSLIFYFRANHLQRQYYAQFPNEIQFSERNPFIPDSPRSSRALWYLMERKQLNPYLETMRKKIWLRLAIFALWLFIWPLIFVVVNLILLFHGFHL